MVVRPHRSKCFSAFIGAFYVCYLLEGAISASVGKVPIIVSNGAHVHSKSINPNLYNKSEQLNYRRHRRKLPNESNEQQFNLLDDNGLQFQEYQGVFGRPGIDFPVLSHIPITKFNCRNVKNSNTGYYADLDTQCQVFHVCDGGRKVSFLCPNGTIFRQSHLICDWWFRVECERSPELYDQSVHMLEADQHVYKQRAQTINSAMQNLLTNGFKDSMMIESPVSVTNNFNSESNLPKSIPNNAYNPIISNPAVGDFKSNFMSNDNANPQNIFANPNAVVNANTNKVQHANHFGPSFGVTQAPLNPVNSHFQTFAPVTQSPNAASANFNTPSSQNDNYSFTQSANRNYNHQSNANTANQNLKPQSNKDSFNDVRFDFQNNAITFPQPNTSPAAPASPSATPPTLRQNSNWAPANSFNSISPPHTNYNFEQKTTPAKFSAAFPSKSQPINVPNFTPGRFPLIDQDYPTTRFSSTTPRSLAPLSQTNYNFDFTTIAPPQTAFTKSYFPMTNNPFRTTFETYSPISFTTPSANNFFNNFSQPTMQLQQQIPSEVNSLTTTSSSLDNNYFREQQVLAETASFTGNSKYPKWQDYYLYQNFNSLTNGNNKPTTFSSTPSSTSLGTTPAPETTTLNLYDMLFDSGFLNNTNQSYALYFPSDDNVIDLLNLATPQPEEGVTNYISNQPKPSVSELLLNALGTSVKPQETTQQPAQETFPILLRNETKEAFDHLFPKEKETTTEAGSDLMLENSNGLVQSSSPKTLPTAETLNEKLKFKSSPDFRELAQIFSRALSAYLEDPEQFRRILSEVRPTEPPTPEISAKKESSNDEVLAFSDDERSTRKTTTSPSTKSTIRDPETFAEEINNFMFDNPPYYSQVDSADFNVNETYYPFSTQTAQPTPPITFTVSPVIDMTRNLTTSSYFGTTLPNTVSPKVNLYEDKSNKFFDNSAQNLQEEPLLITADTQSFVLSDNLVRYPLYGKYGAKYTLSPPNLKSSAFPQFGVRTSSASFSPMPFISSRADFVDNPQSTPETRRTTADEEESLRTTLNMFSSNTAKPLFNESAVDAMVNMMNEAKTNTALRNKLVLLLVNDRNTLENRSVKDLKSKLLKALVVAPSTKAYTESYTEQPLSRRKVRKGSRVETARKVVTTTSSYRPNDISKSTERTITRAGRSTARPKKQVEADGLSDTDSRAIDLLRTLYSLASNNWNR